MSGDAGTRMPEHQINIYHCGTTFSGWLNGKHPTENGLIVDRQVCFTKGFVFYGVTFDLCRFCTVLNLAQPANVCFKKKLDKSQ